MPTNLKCAFAVNSPPTSDNYILYPKHSFEEYTDGLTVGTDGSIDCENITENPWESAFSPILKANIQSASARPAAGDAITIDAKDYHVRAYKGSDTSGVLTLAPDTEDDDLVPEAFAVTGDFTGTINTPKRLGYPKGRLVGYQVHGTAAQADSTRIKRHWDGILGGDTEGLLIGYGSDPVHKQVDLPLPKGVKIHIQNAHGTGNDAFCFQFEINGYRVHG